MIDAPAVLELRPAPEHPGVAMRAVELEREKPLRDKQQWNADLRHTDHDDRREHG